MSDGPISIATLPDDLNRGHRARLRERFDSGADGLADYELLELVLFRSIPRQDTKPLAKALIRRFGSFAEVLSAPRGLLREIPGVGESVAHDLKLLETVSRRFAKGAVAARDALSSFNAVIEYCRAAMAFEMREHFRVLFLDKRNKLIADEVQQSGTVDHTPVYPREIVRRALELSATAVILVHNHPSGDPAPSAADIAMTREIIKVAKPLGIEIHDHIIVGRDGHTSFKSRGLI